MYFWEAKFSLHVQMDHSLGAASHDPIEHDVLIEVISY